MPLQWNTLDIQLKPRLFPWWPYIVFCIKYKCCEWLDFFYVLTHGLLFSRTTVFSERLNGYCQKGQIILPLITEYSRKNSMFIAEIILHCSVFRVMHWVVKMINKSSYLLHKCIDVSFNSKKPGLFTFLYQVTSRYSTPCHYELIKYPM